MCLFFLRGWYLILNKCIHERIYLRILCIREKNGKAVADLFISEYISLNEPFIASLFSNRFHYFPADLRVACFI